MKVQSECGAGGMPDYHKAKVLSRCNCYPFKVEELVKQYRIGTYGYPLMVSGWRMRYMESVISMIME